jgi:hypothetical protein
MFLYKNHQKNEAIAKERAQYAQAEKDLDALSAQIITKFGQPDDQKKVKECGHTSSDFGTGILFCTVSQFLFYPVANLDEANTKVAEVSTINPAFSGLITQDGKPILAAKSLELSRLDCSIGFSVHPSSDNLENLGYTSLYLKNSELGLLVEFSCSAKHPKAEYFPLKDS